MLTPQIPPRGLEGAGPTQPPQTPWLWGRLGQWQQEAWVLGPPLPACDMLGSWWKPTAGGREAGQTASRKAQALGPSDSGRCGRVQRKHYQGRIWWGPISLCFISAPGLADSPASPL